MNLTEAIGYSFKTWNIRKTLMIVLVFVIAGVSVAVASLALQSIVPLFLILPVLLIYSLFIGGYTISIIEAVMDGDETLPQFAVWQNLGRGAMLVIAAIVYAIPFFVLFALIFLFFGMGTSSAAGDSATLGAAPIVIMCGVLIAMVFLGFAVTYSLIVGQVRYAVEGRAGALFNIGKNFSIVMSNLGTTFGLFIRQIGLAVLFGIGSSILSNILSQFFSGVFNRMVYMETVDEITRMGFPLLLAFSMFYIVTMTVNLMQSFSGAHLIAGYGLDLGFGTGKSKNRSKADNNIMILLFVAVLLLGLIACGVVFGLALLGPAIGETFSNMITQY